MKNIRISALILCLALALSALGCNNYKAGNFPAEVGGAKLTAEPTAVASLSPYISEIIYGLGLENKLVARSSYCAFNGNVRELPDAGTVTQPDVQKLTELAVQVVFAATELPAESAEALKTAGIQLCILPTPTTVAAVSQRVEEVARLLKGNNRVDQTCEAYLEKFNSELEYVAYKLKNAVEPTGVFFLSSEGSVATGDTLMGAVMEIAGIKNIAAAYTGYTMSMDEIVAADPDIIIVTNPPSISYVTSDPVLSALAASAAGYVYEISNEYAEFASPSLTKTAYALAYAVHGELMAAPDKSLNSEDSVPQNPQISVESAVTSAG